MVELVDAVDSKSTTCESVGVQVPPGAPKIINNLPCFLFLYLTLNFQSNFNMSVNADISLLKQLREESGAGMSACRDALIEANNIYKDAVKILREKGIASAGKKVGRDMKEGMCGILSSDNSVALIKMSCETDFVVRNEKFHLLATEIISAFEKSNVSDLESAKNIKLPSGATITDEIAAACGIIGENIALSDARKLSVSKGKVASYIHTQIKEGFGKIAVAVALESDGDISKLDEIGKKICMQIAAFAPTFTSVEDVREDFIQNEKEIYTKQLENTGKNPDIIQKIVDGKLQKTYQECVLLEQEFVLDNKLRVKDFLAESSKSLGHDIKCVNFVRLSV